MKIKRRKTRQIKVGSVRIGGGAPVSIQSMTNCDTSDVKSAVAQIRKLEAAGCEIVRVAVKDPEDAAAIANIKKKISVPLVSDIHFDYRLALAAIDSGADKIRINPGNIWKHREISRVAKAAKEARIPIRVGVNSGSAPSSTPDALVKAALSCVKVLEDHHFRDIILSLKASGVMPTIEAYRKIASACDYPLHLGVTAAGPYDSGIVKSSIGIGGLLADGIGDTIRVSLTDDPAEEVEVARRILSALNIRRFGPDIISCPTCGRCRVDLVRIVADLESKLNSRRLKTCIAPITVAVMGCEVNGPGEAREADIGIAAGKGSGVLFINGKIVKRVKEKDFTSALVKEIKKFK